MDGYVVFPNDGSFLNLDVLPLFNAAQLITIAERKRAEPYREKRAFRQAEPDHFDLLQHLVQVTIEQNKLIAEVRDEVKDLKERLLG